MKSNGKMFGSSPNMTLRLATIITAISFLFAAFSCKTNTDGEPDTEPTLYSITVASGIEHGTVSASVTSAEAGTEIKLTATADDGYELDSFSVKDSGDNAITVTDGTFTMPASNVTVSATFKESASDTPNPQEPDNPSNPDNPDTPDNPSTDSETQKYTVTFSTDGGSTVTSQSIESGKTATEPTAPTKDGFTFGGWYTDSDFTTAFSFSTEITANITLYAKWIEASKPTCTVTFSVDGAETKQTVAEGEKASKPTDPTKTGYTFAGWYNGETAFDFNTAITANITLTAKWSAITYSITYALDGGTNADANPATYTIESDDITLSSASKTGYTFSGWQNADGETVTKIAKGTTGDITLTALWTTASGVTITIAPASEIAVTTAEDSSTITLTAEEGFTGYSWRIDGELAEDVNIAWLSEDGRSLKILKARYEVWYEDDSVDDIIEDNGKPYQISLYATKNGIPCGTQVTVKPNNIIKVSINENVEKLPFTTIKTLVFEAEEGFTDYSWSIDGTVVSKVLMTYSESTAVWKNIKGNILTINESTFEFVDEEYEIILTATKDEVQYTAKILIIVDDDDESSKS